MEHDGGGLISYGVPGLLLLALTAALWRSGFFGRIVRLAEAMVLGNWQLALLGAAAIALSLASGYTTFDGLRNFTSAPLLSVLVAFGIQGVMLIVSWLIGESFATGMGAPARAGSHPGAITVRETMAGGGLAAMLAGLAFYWALTRHDAVILSGDAGGRLRVSTDWTRVADVALYFLLVLAALGLVALAIRRGSDVARRYVQGARLILKDAMLWVMLIACMGASVFFSFDSHFAAIFPAEQRKRAAEMRTLNQVAAAVVDIGERGVRARAAEAARLLEGESWRAYESELMALAVAARGVQAELEAALVAGVEQRQRGIGEQQERIAGAERSQSALLRKRDELEAELQRLAEVEACGASSGSRRSRGCGRRNAGATRPRHGLSA